MITNNMSKLASTIASETDMFERALDSEMLWNKFGNKDDVSKTNPMDVKVQVDEIVQSIKVANRYVKKMNRQWRKHLKRSREYPYTLKVQAGRHFERYSMFPSVLQKHAIESKVIHKYMNGEYAEDEVCFEDNTWFDDEHWNYIDYIVEQKEKQEEEKRKARSFEEAVICAMMDDYGDDPSFYDYLLLTGGRAQ